MDDPLLVMISKLIFTQWSLVDTVASTEPFDIFFSKNKFSELMVKLTKLGFGSCVNFINFNCL